jgi:hypothetical protein
MDQIGVVSVARSQSAGVADVDGVDEQRCGDVVTAKGGPGADSAHSTAPLASFGSTCGQL